VVDEMVAAAGCIPEPVWPDRGVWIVRFKRSSGMRAVSASARRHTGHRVGGVTSTTEDELNTGATVVDELVAAAGCIPGPVWLERCLDRSV